MILANFDLSTLLKRKGKEDTVDERMIRVAMTRFYSREIFLGFKSLTFKDGVKLSLWHPRYLFRAFSAYLTKKSHLKKS